MGKLSSSVDIKQSKGPFKRILINDLVRFQNIYLPEALVR